MPSTRDIRRRIKSVKNTAQITKAMQLVAASKMKKAQDQAVAGRPYATTINKVLVNLRERTSEEVHPLMEVREGNRELIVVITSDKGLCGALNTNLLRKVTDASKGNDQASFVSVGSKGRVALTRLKRNLLADFPVKDPVKFDSVRPIARFVIEKFLAGEIDRVRIAFTNFVSTLTQDPLLETLLPINPVHLGREKAYEGMSGESSGGTGATDAALSAGYTFEPSPSGVFDVILPQYIGYQIYQMILEARASEHSSRMVAMKNATDNAKQLIKDLTLEYNKLRQASITNELLEISTAQKALE